MSKPLIEYDLWMAYKRVCREQKVEPSLRDFAIWLSDQSIELEEVVDYVES